MKHIIYLALFGQVVIDEIAKARSSEQTLILLCKLYECTIIALHATLA